MRARTAGAFSRRRVAGLGGAALAVVAPWLGWVLVVEGHVVPGWGLGLVLLAVALLLLWYPRSGRVPAADEASVARRTVPRWVRVVATGVTVVSVGLAIAGDLTFGADYRVLPAEASADCRVVTRERSFLMAGGGDVYTVRGFGVGRRTGSWTADDGYRPVGAGTYDLALGLGGGTLTVRGTPSDPVVPADHTIDCR